MALTIILDQSNVDFFTDEAQGNQMAQPKMIVRLLDFYKKRNLGS